MSTLKNSTVKTARKLTFDTARILFLDHEDGILDVIESYAKAKRWGNISTTKNIEKAKRESRDGEIDILVSDLSMGEINGVAFLEEIHTLTSRLKLKITLAIYSGLGKISENDINKCNELGIHILPPKQSVDLDNLFREISFTINPEERKIKKNAIFAKKFKIIDDDDDVKVKPENEFNEE